MHGCTLLEVYIKHNIRKNKWFFYTQTSWWFAFITRCLHQYFLYVGCTLYCVNIATAYSVQNTSITQVYDNGLITLRDKRFTYIYIASIIRQWCVDKFHVTFCMAGGCYYIGLLAITSRHNAQCVIVSAVYLNAHECVGYRLRVCVGASVHARMDTHHKTFDLPSDSDDARTHALHCCYIQTFSTLNLHAEIRDHGRRPRQKSRGGQQDESNFGRLWCFSLSFYSFSSPTFCPTFFKTRSLSHKSWGLVSAVSSPPSRSERSPAAKHY